MGVFKCTYCGSIYPEGSIPDSHCPKDNHVLTYCPNQEDIHKIQYLTKYNMPLDANAPKCPTCQSYNIQKISTTSKVVHGAAFGLFSKTARSQFKCNNCGYVW